MQLAEKAVALVALAGEVLVAAAVASVGEVLAALEVVALVVEELVENGKGGKFSAFRLIR